MTTPAFTQGMRVSGELSPGRVRFGTVIAVFPHAIVIKWDATRPGRQAYEDTFDLVDIRKMCIQPVEAGQE